MKVRVQGHRYVNPGPYPEDKPPTNTVRFTPTQINAIRSATSEVGYHSMSTTILHTYIQIANSFPD